MIFILLAKFAKNLMHAKNMFWEFQWRSANVQLFCQHWWWWFSIVVTSLGRSMKLLYVRPG